MSLPSRAGAVREEAWALQVSGQSRAGRHAERKGGCEETGRCPRTVTITEEAACVEWKPRTGKRKRR